MHRYTRCGTSITTVLATMVLAMVAAMAGAQQQSEDTLGSVYAKRGGWHETLVAARDALVEQEAAGASGKRFAGYTSPVLHGGDPAIAVRVDVTGQKAILLYVTGVPNRVGGAATWADARLIAPDGTETIASRLPGLKVLKGRHDLDVNLKSGVSGPLAIAGKPFKTGIHVYADSCVLLPLEGKFARFEALIGIDDWVGKRGAVRFDVVDPAGAQRLDLWNQVARDFPTAAPRREMRWEREDRILDADWTPGAWGQLAARYAKAARRVAALADEAAERAAQVRDAAGVNQVRAIYLRSRELDDARAQTRPGLRGLAAGDRGPEEDFRRAIRPRGRFCRAAGALARQREEVLSALAASAGGAAALAHCQRAAAVAADFDRLAARGPAGQSAVGLRSPAASSAAQPHGDPRGPMDTGYGMGEYLGLPRQSSKCNPGIEEPFDWDNEIAVLAPVRPEGKLTTLYQPDGRRLVATSTCTGTPTGCCSRCRAARTSGRSSRSAPTARGLRQLTPGDQPDVHYYDACYLPNGRIAFISTAPLAGRAVQRGRDRGHDVPDGRRRHATSARSASSRTTTTAPPCSTTAASSTCAGTTPTRRTSGTACCSRMNPDGTGQAEYYGTNSYWPNAIFYARPDPGSSDEGRGHRHRASRGPRRRAGDLRSGQGPARGRRRGAADPRLRPEGRAAHRGQAHRAQLAEVPPPLAAEREVLPRLLQADARRRSGASTWSTCSTTWCSSRRWRARRCWSRSRCERRRGRR